jgi:inner membrane protein
MPSVVSRPAAPLALTPLLPDEQRSPCVILRGAVCPALPDLDVAGFEFDVPYGHMLGHRGLSYSIVFAPFDNRRYCFPWRPVASLIPREKRL